jgi:hypothetical protein
VRPERYGRGRPYFVLVFWPSAFCDKQLGIECICLLTILFCLLSCFPHVLERFQSGRSYTWITQA